MSGYTTNYSAGILPGTTGQADPEALGQPGNAGAALGTGTGRYGIATLEAELMSSNPFADLWAWLSKPFTEAMSPIDVMLLVGVVMGSMILWSLVLYHIRIAAEAI